MSTKAEALVSGCLADAADDEPVFTLRATDPRAPEAIRYWAHLYICAKVHGVPLPGSGADPKDVQAHMTERQRRIDKHDEALKVAADMEVWRKAHPL